jgi:hypothetical protein
MVERRVRAHFDTENMMTSELQSATTGKKIGCVQHDCDGCKAMDKSLAEEIWLCESQVAAESLAANTVKEAWWKGRLNGLRTVLAMRSNV